MFFNGGLIPTYITIRSLHLVNTIWVMLIPFCLNVFYLIIARTYFETNVPVELFDAARMDGCTNTAFFIWIVLPLSKAILAVIGLYYAVLHWNEFFMALIYIRDQSLYPLQLILRDILVRNQVMSGAVDSGAAAVQMADLIKYGVIIIAILPMIVVYPFVQRYFVKGALVGAIKG
jgi:putative aldouronate transport system permease protein